MGGPGRESAAQPVHAQGERPQGPAWYATPTVAYAQGLGYDVTPIEAYVRYDNGRYLDGWCNRLRDAFFATMADLGVHADLSPADFLTAMDDYKSGDPELATVVSAVKAKVRPVLSDDPVLQHDLRLPDSWWQDPVGTLEKVAAVDTDHVAVRQQYRAGIPEFLGIPAPAALCWTLPIPTCTGPTSPCR
ncbi:hypothetical protein GCM10010350_77300 [Streptomyces galilaeus]|nr:hypothetical protein GCM10010350_77300 [Streptomyces galilaeus]